MTSSSSCGSSGFCAPASTTTCSRRDPAWVTESIGGMGDDGRSLVTRTSFRILQTLNNLGPAPEPNLTVWYSPRLPDSFRRYAAKVAIDTSALQFESDEIMRRDVGRRRRDCLRRITAGARQAGAVVRRPRQPGQVPALCHQRWTRRDDRRAGRAAIPCRQRRRAAVRRRAREVRRNDGLARRRLRQRHERHPLHARQVLLRAGRDGAARLQPGPHDVIRHRRDVGRGRQPVGDPARERLGPPGRDRAGHGLSDEGDVPGIWQ